MSGKETTSNFRITVSQLGSGWAAILLCDVTDDHGTYTDVYSTGIGRFKTRKNAEIEARHWSETDKYQLEGVTS